MNGTRRCADHPRLPDWPERLAALVEARRHAPFAWGRQDCVAFAADAAIAVTGRDPLAAWRGRYGSEAEADAILADHGGDLYRFMVLLMEAFGAPACPPRLAQRGDLALVQLGNLLAVGVVTGGAIAAPGQDGLAFAPPAAARRAWAV